MGVSCSVQRRPPACERQPHFIDEETEAESAPSARGHEAGRSRVGLSLGSGISGLFFTFLFPPEFMFYSGYSKCSTKQSKTKAK